MINHGMSASFENKPAPALANNANGAMTLYPATVHASQESSITEIPTPVTVSAANQLINLVKQNPVFILLSAIFRAMRKRWLVALTGACSLVALAVFAVWYFMPPAKYTARALLQFDLVPSSLAESPHQQYYLSNLTALQKTHAALIRSRTVLQAALSKPEVQTLDLLKTKSDPLTFLETHINADFGISPEIMRVTISGQDAYALQTILHALTHAYLDEVANKEHAQLRAELGRTKELTSRYEEKIKAKQARLRELEQAAGSGQTHALEVFLRGYLEQLDRTRRELAYQRQSLRQVTAELNTLTPKLSLARRLLEPPETSPWYIRLFARDLLEYLISAAQVDLALQGDPQFAEKRRELQKLQAEFEAASALLSPQLPLDRREALLKAKRDAILETRLQLDELSLRLRPVIRRQLAQEFLVTGQQRASELSDKRLQLIHLETHLQEEVVNLEKLIAQLKRNHLDLQWLKEEIEADQQAYKRLQARQDQLVMLCEAPTRVKLFEDAVILPAYEGKKRWLYIILAASAALTIWLAGLVTWEWRTQPIYGPEELTGKVGAPIIASLPYVEQSLILPAQIHNHKGLPSLDVSRFLESVDALRTLLIYMLQNHLSPVVLVTSAVQGEGKTSLSCHLAASVARAGRRVLLVDTDLRRARAHKLLGAPLSPGLSEVLQEQLAWQHATRCDILPNLDFLPAGEGSRSGISLLGQDFFQRLLKQWRECYELVILDSSPVLLVADPLTMLQGVDTVLLSAMYKLSTLPRTQIAYQRLVSLGARILGVVVNGISVRQYDYYYGNYHYYQHDNPQLPESAERQT